MLTPHNQHEYELTVVHHHYNRKEIIKIHDLLIYFYEKKDCRTRVNVVPSIVIPNQLLCSN
jgi:hypothetical protein